MADSTRYYIRSGQEILGPYRLAQLERLERRGQLRDTQLFSTDQRTWRPLRELEALYPPRPEPAPQEPAAADSAGSGQHTPPTSRTFSRHPTPHRQPVLPQPHSGQAMPQTVVTATPVVPVPPQQPVQGVSVVVQSEPAGTLGTDPPVTSTPAPAATVDAGRIITFAAAGLAVLVLVIGLMAMLGGRDSPSSGGARAGTASSTPGFIREGPDGEVSVGLASTAMDFTRQEQEGRSWCWAACIQMVLTAHGISKSQTEIVRKTFGDTRDEGGSMLDIANNLNGWQIERNARPFLLKTRIGGGPPSITFLKDQLLLGRPLIVGYSQGPGVAGHAVVITAFKYRTESDGNVRLTQITVRDPAGHYSRTLGKREMPLAEFLNITGFFYVVPF